MRMAVQPGDVLRQVMPPEGSQLETPWVGGLFIFPNNLIFFTFIFLSILKTNNAKSQEIVRIHKLP